MFGIRVDANPVYSRLVEFELSAFIGVKTKTIKFNLTKPQAHDLWAKLSIMEKIGALKSK